MADTWWVDNEAGTPAGPGTQIAPYQTVGQALAVAVTGDTILIVKTDTPYTGAGNYELVFGGPFVGTSWLAPGLVIRGYPDDDWPVIQMNYHLSPWSEWFLQIDDGNDYIAVDQLKFACTDDHADVRPQAFLLYGGVNPMHVRLGCIDTGTEGWYVSNAGFVALDTGGGSGVIDLEISDSWLRGARGVDKGVDCLVRQYGGSATITLRDCVTDGWSNVVGADGGEYTLNVVLHHSTVLNQIEDPGNSVAVFNFGAGLAGTVEFYDAIFAGCDQILRCAGAVGMVITHRNNCYWDCGNLSDGTCVASLESSETWNTVDPGFAAQETCTLCGGLCMLDSDYTPTSDAVCGGGDDGLYIGAIPCTVAPEPPVPADACEVCTLAMVEDYVVRTFDLYLAKPGEALVAVGSIRTGDVKELLETHGVFGPDPSDPSPRLNAFRSGMEIDAEIEAVTYQNIARLLGEDPINIAGGWQINFGFGGLRPLYRVVLEHTFAIGGKMLVVYFHRACIESAFQLPFDSGSWSSMPVTIRAFADWSHDENPYGYSVLGDSVGVS